MRRGRQGSCNKWEGQTVGGRAPIIVLYSYKATAAGAARTSHRARPCSALVFWSPLSPARTVFPRPMVWHVTLLSCVLYAVSNIAAILHHTLVYNHIIIWLHNIIYNIILSYSHLVAGSARRPRLPRFASCFMRLPRHLPDAARKHTRSCCFILRSLRTSLAVFATSGKCHVGCIVRLRWWTSSSWRTSLALFDVAVLIKQHKMITIMTI